MPFYFKGGGNLIFKKMSLGIKESKKYFYFLLKLSARNPTGSIKSQYLENKFIHPTGGGGKNKKNALIFFFILASLWSWWELFIFIYGSLFYIFKGFISFLFYQKYIRLDSLKRKNLIWKFINYFHWSQYEHLYIKEKK